MHTSLLRHVRNAILFTVAPIGLSLLSGERIDAMKNAGLTSMMLLLLTTVLHMVRQPIVRLDVEPRPGRDASPFVAAYVAAVTVTVVYSACVHLVPFSTAWLAAVTVYGAHRKGVDVIRLVPLPRLIVTAAAQALALIALLPYP